MADPAPERNQTAVDALRVPRRGLRGSVREFFLAEEVPYGLALCRMVLPPILLYVVLRRWPHAVSYTHLTLPTSDLV